MFKAKVEFTKSEIAGLLCTAFEGGVGYWAEIVGHRKPKKPCSVLDWKDYPTYTYPIDGGAVLVKDLHTGKVHTLNQSAIRRGLDLMAERNPYQFGQLLADNEDAVTGDVFLQFCLLGEELYG